MELLGHYYLFLFLIFNPLPNCWERRTTILDDHELLIPYDFDDSLCCVIITEYPKKKTLFKTNATSTEIKRNVTTVFNDTMKAGPKELEQFFYRTTKKRNKFVIPWKNYGLPSRFQAFKWIFTRNPVEFPTVKDIKSHPLLNPYVIQSSDDMLSTHDNNIKYTWITHSTVLVSFNGFNILTDPFFSGIVGPLYVRFLAKFSNCKSYGLLPLNIDQLPQIDAVVISHDHFDHLDEISVQQLYLKYGDDLIWFTPLNYRSWFRDKFSIENVVELEWWQEAVYKKSLKCVVSTSHIPHRSRLLHEKIQLQSNDTDTIIFSLCPSQHWCGRNFFLVDRRLWGSWVVRSSNFSFFFGGDTGYNPHIFKSIGHRYGPLDLSAIPIGAYEPRHIMRNEHLSPWEAVQVHRDLGSKRSFGIHWGAFHFSDEGFFQPPQDLQKASLNEKIPPHSFSAIRIGQTYSIDK